MGLRDAWARVAASRAHVLIAEAPGAFRQRVALERALDGTGWCATDAVADADVLAVVGRPGAELRVVIDQAWAQMSEPRARIEVHEGSDVVAALEEARRALQDAGAQRSRARRRTSSQDESPQHEEERSGVDESHEGHRGGHDHGGMSPDGIPLADGAEDRDGLEMDELHLPLGPVLAHWPPGVVLRLSLHGDVIADAEVEHLDGAENVPTPTPAEGPGRAARLLDGAASVLMLAGLPAEAANASRLRDRLLDGAPVDRSELDRLRTRLRHNRVLRWLLRGLVLDGDDRASDELHDRTVDLVDRASKAIDGDAPVAPSGPALDALPALVRGRELAAVRLWMAALGADLTLDAPAEASGA